MMTPLQNAQDFQNTQCVMVTQYKSQYKMKTLYLSTSNSSLLQNILILTEYSSCYSIFKAIEKPIDYFV